MLKLCILNNLNIHARKGYDMPKRAHSTYLYSSYSTANTEKITKVNLCLFLDQKDSKGDKSRQSIYLQKKLKYLLNFFKLFISRLSDRKLLD